MCVAVQMALCRTYHKYSVEGVATTAERYTYCTMYMYIHMHTSVQCVHSAFMLE